MIKIMSQNKTRITQVENVEYSDMGQHGHSVWGTDKQGRMINLATYQSGYRCEKAMLHILKSYNDDPNKIIQLPEDDEDVERGRKIE